LRALLRKKGFGKWAWHVTSGSAWRSIKGKRDSEGNDWLQVGIRIDAKTGKATAFGSYIPEGTGTRTVQRRSKPIGGLLSAQQVMRQFGIR
jgi:hypothetical protein